jgi:hypothetical protein
VQPAAGITVTLELLMAMIAAMKNVLSPISLAPITPMDLPSASTKRRERLPPRPMFDVDTELLFKDRSDSIVNRARSCLVGPRIGLLFGQGCLDQQVNTLALSNAQ